MHPSHKRQETEAPIGRDAGDEEHEEYEHIAVGPAKTTLEGRKDEGTEDPGGGGDGADENERGGFHVECRFPKEDRRGGDRRETYRVNTQAGSG